MWLTRRRVAQGLLLSLVVSLLLVLVGLLVQMVNTNPLLTVAMLVGMAVVVWALEYGA